MLQTNIDRLNLKDFEVQARVTLYRTKPTVVWTEGTTRREVDQDQAEGVEIPENCWEGHRILETLTVDVGAGAVSQALGMSMSSTYQFAHENKWEHPYCLDLFVGDAKIGFITDNCFHYIAAPTLREYVGWIWASGMGRSKAITADLDAAVEEIAGLVHRSGGRIAYEPWSHLLSRIYVRGETVPCEHFGYINGTLAVATRTLLGNELPGFNICY